jgi:hypothetical protein
MNRREAMKLVLGATLSAPALATGSGRAGPIVDRKNASAITPRRIRYPLALFNGDRVTEEEKLRAIEYFSKFGPPGLCLSDIEQ